jgi:hypothetical protein
LEKVSEVFGIRLVRADILGGVCSIELGAKQVLAGRERLPVDVGKDDESVPLLQPGQSFMRVSKGRSTPNRLPELACG